MRRMLALCAVGALALVSVADAIAGSRHRSARATQDAEPPPVELQLADFAVQLPVNVTGQNGVVQLRLPPSAYQHITDAELRDLRIFNASGQPIAFAFHAPRPGREETRRIAAAHIFPVHASGHASGDEAVDVNVTTRADGTVVSVRSRKAPASSGARAQVQALILDLGGADKDEALEALELVLPGEPREYRADVTIDLSNDLKLWDRVAAAPVFRLSSAAAESAPESAPEGAGEDGTLLRNRIELPPLKGTRAPRYARVQWTSGAPLVFSQVKVHRRAATEVAEALEELTLAPEPGRIAGDWMYPSRPGIRAEQVGLQLPQANTVYPAAIGTYREVLNPKRSWTLDTVTQNTFYRLLQEGDERASSVVVIAARGATEWVVRPRARRGQASAAAQSSTRASTEADASNAPKLVLRWRPATIVFTAQGPGPFAVGLGYTARKLPRGDSELALVAPGFSERDLDRLERATPGTIASTETRERGMAPAVKPDVAETSLAQAAQQRKYALWAVLLVGLAVLSFMCWRLYKQMLATEPAADAGAAQPSNNT
jgi:hypothetical protein